MARRALLIGALAIAIAIAGCQVPQRVPPLVIGPFDDAPSLATFQRIVRHAQARGYEPTSMDPRAGVFQVRALSSRARRVGEHGFVVQCYADGLVQITPVGARVRRDGHVFVVPAAVRTEMVELAQSLAEVRLAP